MSWGRGGVAFSEITSGALGVFDKDVFAVLTRIAGEDFTAEGLSFFEAWFQSWDGEENGPEFLFSLDVIGCDLCRSYGLSGWVTNFVVVIVFGMEGPVEEAFVKRPDFGEIRDKELVVAPVIGFV